MTCSGIAADRVVGIAKSMQLIHWDEQEVPKDKGKKHEVILRKNEEAKKFKEDFKKFEKKVDSMDISKSMKIIYKFTWKIIALITTFNTLFFATLLNRTRSTHRKNCSIR